MRKVWASKVFLLCMACLICMGGLCAAKDKDTLTFMWEGEADYMGEKYKYYIDDNATKIIDHEGRKYLQVYIQRNKVIFEQIWFVPTWREIERAHWTLIFDIENRKVFFQEHMNKEIKNKKGKQDISTMKQNFVDCDQYIEPMLQWIETHRQSVVDEIRRANGGNPGTIGNAGQPAVSGAGSSNLSKFPSLDVTYEDMVYDASTDTYRNYGTYHFYNNGPRLPMDAGAPSGLKYVYTLRYFSNRKNVDFSIDYYIDPQSVSRYSGISGDTVRGIFYKHITHDDWSGWSTWTVQGFKVYIDYNMYSIWGGERDEENAIRWGWGPVANAAAFDETRYIFNDEDHTPEEIERMLSESPSYDVLSEEYIGKPTLRFHAKEDTKNDHGGDPHYNSSYFDDQLRAIALLSAVDD